MNRHLLLLTMASVACAGGPRTAPTSSAQLLVERGIERAGGAEALRRASALSWDGEATIHAGGRLIRIAGTWEVQPPDTAVVTTWDVTRGPSTRRSLVLAAPRGWSVNAQGFTPMPPAMLAAERVEFYLYDVMRLVPLLGNDVELQRIAADTAGNEGVVVRQAGRPDVSLWFDATGRMAHLHVVLPNADGSGSAVQDMWFTGTVEAASVRWPARVNLLQNGQPYFDLTLKTLRIGTAVRDSLVRGPSSSSPPE